MTEIKGSGLNWAFKKSGFSGQTIYLPGSITTLRGLALAYNNDQISTIVFGGKGDPFLLETLEGNPFAISSGEPYTLQVYTNDLNKPMWDTLEGLAGVREVQRISSIDD
jgi:hypothetical protein